MSIYDTKQIKPTNTLIINLQEFKKEINEQIVKYPLLKEEILDFYELAINEIEEGGSASHEIELCQESIKQLIDENI